MVTIYSFGQHFGVEDPSPYVLKIMAYCKMANIEFTAHAGAQNLRTAPKSRLPFIKDDEQIIDDSFFILRHLKEKYPDTLDDHLSSEQKATTALIMRSLDENFYWLIVHSRWLNDTSWPIVKQSFFGDMPWPLKAVIPYIARKDVAKRFLKQGMGKHSDDELMTMADDTLSSLSTMLGDKRYLWGDKPGTLDAGVYAFLAQLYIATIDTPLKKQARQYSNLAEYCMRIQKEYF